MPVTNSFSPNTKIKSSEVNQNFTDITSGVAGVMNYDKVRVTKSANQSISDATSTNVTFNQEDFDTNAMHDNATNNERLVCKTAGKYLVSASVRFAGHATDATIRDVTVVHSGGSVIAETTIPQVSATFDISVTASGIYNFAVNEYATCEVYQTSGGNLDVLAARTHFSMTLLP